MQGARYGEILIDTFKTTGHSGAHLRNTSSRQQACKAHTYQNTNTTLAFQLTPTALASGGTACNSSTGASADSRTTNGQSQSSELSVPLLGAQHLNT